MQPGRDLALITGASSGIGEAFARQLAARRIDLVLAARRRDRLEALAAELVTAHGIRVEVIENDLGHEEGAKRLVSDLASRSLTPTVLVNNAGFGLFGPFVEQQPAEIESLLQVNVRAMTFLCRLLAEPMAKARRGYILNVASFAALAPIPRYAVYSGAKAYVVAFSQALRHELARRNVRVSVICPGFTRTEFHDVAGHEKTRLMRATELSAEQVAKAGLRGLERGKPLIVPGWWYKLNALAGRVLPRSMLSALSAQTVK